MTDLLSFNDIYVGGELECEPCICLLDYQQTTKQKKYVFLISDVLFITFIVQNTHEDRKVKYMSREILL